jgi:hypothetical protein
MTNSIEIPESSPKVLSLVRIGEQAFFVDLRLGQFRSAVGPLVFVAFDSEDGRRLCDLANVLSCPACGTHIIVTGALRAEGLRCVKCFSRLA